MDDLISRKAAIDCVTYDVEHTIECLKALSSAQPEQNGKWIYNSPVTMKCDQCGFVIKDWDWHRFKYCPNCGADMRGEQDDESRSNSNAQTDTRARGMGATDKSSGI